MGGHQYSFECRWGRGASQRLQCFTRIHFYSPSSKTKFMHNFCKFHLHWYASANKPTDLVAAGRLGLWLQRREELRMETASLREQGPVKWKVRYGCKDSSIYRGAVSPRAILRPRWNNDPGAAKFRDKLGLPGSISIWAGMASVTLISLLLTSY